MSSTGTVNPQPAAPAPSRGSLGEWCVRRGLATEAQIRDCLRLQRDEELSGRVAPRMGELLVRMGVLRPEQVTQALAEQQTEIRLCPKCQVRMNVPVRGDALEYRCIRCQGPLVTPQAAAHLDVVEDSVIVVSRDPLPTAVQVAAHIPERRFGKYILVRELGSGGVGRVHQAWDTYLSQYVALKRLNAQFKGETPQMVEQRTVSLIKEARNSVRLRHPGIVSVFDVGRINNEFYMAMEFLQGTTLQEQLVAARRRGRPSPFYEHPKRILRILIEVARAAHYAHTRPSPIIHCDLKPANILADAESHAHIFDFGLARNLRTERGEEGEISGTPSYMAPEQAAGRTAEIDARTDVWGLGAILYEMLCGRPPFVGEALDVIRKTIAERPQPPKEALDDTTRRMRADEIQTRKLVQIPSFLEDLCMRCLNQDRSARPATMAEFADTLERGLTAPQPERAKPS